jgi:hypothetical protein
MQVLILRLLEHSALLFLLLASRSVLAVPSSPDDPLYAGYRIYEQGMLPDGSPLHAWRPEGITSDGVRAACTGCHRRSGMGTVEGSIDRAILVPPVVGAVLFAPSRYSGTFLDPLHHYQPNASWTRVLTRSAYDDASLARALRTGVDPDNKPLRAPMPRYTLDTAALKSLTAYLRSLSAAPAPGVGTDTLHLATVITPDAPAGQADAVLGVLRAWSKAAHGADKAWQLHVWTLSGTPDGWEKQLADYYRDQPVFAVLSGSGGTEWAPVQRFCETTRLPCVFPVLERIPDTGAEHFSLYYSPGVELEARVLARYLGSGSAPVAAPPPEIIEVVADASGAAAAEALRRQLSGAVGSISVRRYRAAAPAAVLDGVTANQRLVLWLRSSEIAALVDALPDGPAAPVFLSDLLAPSGTLSLPPAWKRQVNFVSLFDDLGLQGEIARLRLKHWLETAGLPSQGDLRVQADVYTACYLFNKATAEMRTQAARRPDVPLSREYLLETLEVLTSKYTDGTSLVDTDSHVAYYGRMSLGPDQRVAVRGGVILRYPAPEARRLVIASERIVP